jgi:hypothetical protein
MDRTRTDVAHVKIFARTREKFLMQSRTEGVDENENGAQGGEHCNAVSTYACPDSSKARITPRQKGIL